MAQSRSFAAFVGCLMLSAWIVEAHFQSGDTQIVPLDRLIANLEQRPATNTPPPRVRLHVFVLEDQSLNGAYEVSKDGDIVLPKIGRVRIDPKIRERLDVEDLLGAEWAIKSAAEKAGTKKATVMVERVQENPRTYSLAPAMRHYALGRAHSMAYALRDEVVRVRTETGIINPGALENKDELPPSEVEHPKDPKVAKTAAAHLQAAITEYRQAVKLAPTHLASQLGLGWCLDQAGDKTNALASYRKALQLAWEADSKSQSFHDSRAVPNEIAAYLLKLLDPIKDAEELAKLKNYQSQLAKQIRAFTPVLIPLEADAPLAELVNPDARVAFDLDGTGSTNRWGWITPKAGWLVYDHDGKGKITSGLQLFGSVTFWIFWRNGYEALTALDDNGDGVLNGTELKGLALWQDSNSNGISEAGEVKPLAAWGITEISCRHETHTSQIPYNPIGVTFHDGTTRPSYDWIMRANP